MLSAIVPVSGPHEKYKNLFVWLEEFQNPEVEIILVTDSISGEGLKSLESLGNLVSVRVLSGTFGNPGSARNHGLNYSSGSWTCFWDCDDIPNVDSFLAMCRETDISLFDVCIGTFFTTSPNGELKKSQELNQQWLTEELSSNPGIWRIAFKTDFVRDLVFPQYQMGEDQIYIQRVFFRNPRIHLSKRAVYNYFQGLPFSLTGNLSSKADIRFALNDTFENLFWNPNARLLHQNFVKQILTSLKFSPNSAKLYGPRMLSSFLIRNSFSSTPKFILNCFRLMKYRFTRGK